MRDVLWPQLQANYDNAERNGKFLFDDRAGCVAKCKSLRAALKKRISDGAASTGHGGPNDPGTPIAGTPYPQQGPNMPPNPVPLESPWK